MHSLRNLFLATLLLTFVAGLGTGAWVGSLLAAPPAGSPVDRRAQDFLRAFPDLDASQLRELRVVLAQYDHQAEKIKQPTTEQVRDLRQLEGACIDRIREILSPQQREDYDRRLDRR